MFPRKKEKPKEEHLKAAQHKEQETVNEEQAVKELQKQVESLQKEKDDIFAKLQRMAADYDNFQKRSAKQTADSIEYEKDRIIKALLPVLDDFERALAHAEEGDSVAEGVRLVYEHLKSVLRAQGVEQIKAEGEMFDPAMHEAIVQQSDESREDGVVLEELQTGYKLNDRVIRASRVVVNKTPAAEAELPADDDQTGDTQ